jgi:hypothetical protein
MAAAKAQYDAAVVQASAALTSSLSTATHPLVICVELSGERWTPAEAALIATISDPTLARLASTELNRAVLADMIAWYRADPANHVPAAYTRDNAAVTGRAALVALHGRIAADATHPQHGVVGQLPNA